jgi:hypothetical protein
MPKLYKARGDVRRFLVSARTVGLHESRARSRPPRIRSSASSKLAHVVRAALHRMLLEKAIRYLDAGHARGTVVVIV